MSETDQEVDLDLEFESSPFSDDEMGPVFAGEGDEISASNLEKEDRGVKEWLHEPMRQKEAANGDDSGNDVEEPRVQVDINRLLNTDWWVCDLFWEWNFFISPVN